MKIRPILFSTPMVQSISENRKTQTRRIIKPQPIASTFGKIKYFDRELTINSLKNHSKYHIGDIIWVRETWQYSDDLEEPYLYKQKELEELIPEVFKRMTWKPSIFMPKVACRIFLKVTNVRVERLGDISEEDAKFEGIAACPFAPGYKHYTEPSKFLPYKDKDSASTSFFSLWMSINGAASLDANPFVFVYDFIQVERPNNFLS